MAGVIDKLFNRTTAGLERHMDLAVRRHEAITSNIANAETPQYRASDLNFERELEAAFGKVSGELKKTDPRHIDEIGSQPAHLAPDLSGATKADGNNVDIDIQMGKLAYNSGQFTMTSNMMRKKLAFIKRIISESR